MNKKVAVVIPCYRVADKILDVLALIGPEVSRVLVVDDCCPEGSGNLVLENCHDPRVRVLFHSENRGVGGATITGFRTAIEEGMEVVAKLDGDGQMDPTLLPNLIRPILCGKADYSKGNRFFDPDGLVGMPKLRLFGNTVLSFLSKFSSGYWNIFDPTNGFFSIDARLLAQLPLEKVDSRYFFESDMLFRLGTYRAKVVDIPMVASYGDEQSSMRILSIIPEFLLKHTLRFTKRFFYCYLLRDFSIATIGLLVGLPLITFGAVFGFARWSQSVASGIEVSSGTVMLAALPIIIGTQLLLTFLSYDINSSPKEPVSESFEGWSKKSYNGQG